MLWHRDGWLLTDMGTTGYGAKMHYDYYKTAPPTIRFALIRTTSLRPTRRCWAGIWMTTFCGWIARLIGANRRRSSTAIAASSGTIRPGGTCASAVACCGFEDVLIDLSSVENPHRQQLDWTLHLAAQALDQSGLANLFAQRAAAANDRSNRDAAERLSAAPLCARRRYRCALAIR